MEDTHAQQPAPRTTPPPDDRGLPVARSAVKLIVLAVLLLLMTIPVLNVLDLVRERQFRAEEVRREVGATWGGPQTVGAVVLTLPYRTLSRTLTDQGRELRRSVVREAHFLPEAVEWSGRLEAETRVRGIFEVPVYRARLTAGGRFGPPDLDSLGIDPSDVLWDRAVVRLAVTDPRGIQEPTALAWRGETVPFVPAVPEEDGWAVPRVGAVGLEARLGERARNLLTGAGETGGTGVGDGSGAAFGFDLVLRGTESLRFQPLGQVTQVELSSPWPSPSFDGAFLPLEHEVRDDGFRASWNVTYFGRGLPQSWAESHPGGRPPRERIETAFGLSLVRTADQYQQTERAVKYALLFITLTFTTLFLLELLSPVRLHPVHYLLVGFALCLFYVLLLALAEHVGFLPAYLSATTAVVTLVLLYVRSLVGSWRRAAPLAITLVGLYGYLLGLMRSEDHALLMGSLGLFVVLSLVMYLTRKLDWWTLRFLPPSSTG
jgi:inner membrane protein